MNIVYDTIINALDCLHKNKGVNILIEQATGEVESLPGIIRRGNCSMGIYIPPKTIYNISLRLERNYYVDCVFDEEDFNISKELPIDSIAHLEELKPEDRLTGRWVFIFWNLYQLLTNKRLADMNSEVDNYIFSKTREIRQTL